MVDDAPSLQELARTLLDFRNEYRADRSAYVRLDLYRAEREGLIARVDAVHARLATVEADMKREMDSKIGEWSQVKNNIRGNTIGAVFAVVIAVIGVWLK